MEEARQRLELYRRLRAADGDAGAFWSRAFARLLRRHRRDDGSAWTHAALERATGGIVSRPFASNLATGRIREPGFGKIWAITLVLGASMEEWTEELVPPGDAHHPTD